MESGRSGAERRGRGALSSGRSLGRSLTPSGGGAGRRTLYPRAPPRKQREEGDPNGSGWARPASLPNGRARRGDRKKEIAAPRGRHANFLGTPSSPSSSSPPAFGA